MLYWIMTLVILAGMFLSIWFKKLTLWGAVTGGISAFLIFLGSGITGIVMLGAFFILGTAATSWKSSIKKDLGLAETQNGQRTAGQVVANSGIAALLGVLIFVCPIHTVLFRLMIAAAFASATADTLSSELGNVYGKRFYNILNFRRDQRGLNGVISAEGTAIGVAGSFIIALIYSVGFGWNIAFVAYILIAGTLGNLSDSVLGASIERRRYINNNWVNLLNTLIAVLAMLLLNSID